MGSIQFPTGAGGFDRLTDTNTALASVAGANGFGFRILLYLGDGTADASNTVLLSDGTDSRLEFQRLSSSDTFQFRITTDNGSSMTDVGSGFTVPRNEWVDIYLRVTNGAQTVYMWDASNGTQAVDSDTLAFTGTPSDTTIWRFGQVNAQVSNILANGFTMWKQANDATAIQSMLTNRHSSARDLPTNISWDVPLNQTSGTVTDGDTGLADTSGNSFHFSVEGTGLLWNASDPALDSDVLQDVTSVTVPSAGNTATLVWETGQTLGTVSDTTNYSAKGYLSAGSDGGYDILYLDPDGANSIGESTGDVTGTWGLGGYALSGESLSYTFEESGLWSDDSTVPYRNAAQTAETAGTTNSSTATIGSALTRFTVAPIAVSVTPHNRPITGGSCPVNIAVMNEYAGTQAVRFSWFAADGTTPKSVAFTPHGGSETTATTHTMTASAWVQPFAYMGATAYGEFWGGTIDVSGESDATEIKWEFEVQDHWGTWHSACSDGTAWPQKSLLVHTDPLIIHLSNSGNDNTGDGSSGNPYATLQAAALVTAVRAATKPVEIHHATGTYTIGVVDFRPGGTGSAHEHLITLRPADGATVTYNNVGRVANATKRGNFEFRDLAFNLSSTVYGWTAGTSGIEDEERTCIVNCTYTDGGATKTDGTRGLNVDGDNVYVVGFTQSGKWRGFAINAFNPGSGFRGVQDVILWEYEQTDSGTALQACWEGGYIGRCYIHDNAASTDYGPSEHFDCFHMFDTNGSTHRRCITAYCLVEDNGSIAESYAYNFNLTTCPNVDCGFAFNVRNDVADQPAYQMESYTQNYQMVFNVDKGSIAMIRDETATDDEVGRQVLIQNNLVGTLGSFRDKLRDMPERVLGGNVILDTGSYNDDAETDGSLLIAGSDPTDWGLTDFAGGDYTVGTPAAVTTRPTDFRYDYQGFTINRSSPAYAGAYVGVEDSGSGSGSGDARLPASFQSVRHNRGRASERLRA